MGHYCRRTPPVDRHDVQTSRNAMYAPTDVIFFVPCQVACPCAVGVTGHRAFFLALFCLEFVSLHGAALYTREKEKDVRVDVPSWRV